MNRRTAWREDWRARWRRDWRRRADSGSAAVEFAILLPIFLAILFGIIQFGSVMFLHNNMVNAAREAARRMSVDESFDEAQAEAYAQNYLAGWNLTFSFPNTVAQPGSPDVSIEITVPAADAALINFPITWPGNLVAQASMRPEG
ncbi:TadE family protein [Pelagibius sp. CAU 1746]|uniref:TadE/TadG family type IV pilus assembly protein n=1 Tax=Pelagibius sp. CAU 1746 TaxID=3140370 RepID=UPI00325C0BA3